MEAERRIERMRSDLESLDATIRLFDPSAKPQSIRPRMKRPRPNRFPPGEMTHLVLDILRTADGPLSVRDVTDRLLAVRRVDVSTPRALKLLVGSVRATLARPRDGIVRDIRAGVSVWYSGTDTGSL